MFTDDSKSTTDTKMWLKRTCGIKNVSTEIDSNCNR